MHNRIVWSIIYGEFEIIRPRWLRPPEPQNRRFRQLHHCTLLRGHPFGSLSFQFPQERGCLDMLDGDPVEAFKV